MSIQVYTCLTMRSTFSMPPQGQRLCSSQAMTHLFLVMLCQWQSEDPWFESRAGRRLFIPLIESIERQFDVWLTSNLVLQIWLFCTRGLFPLYIHIDSLFTKYTIKATQLFSRHVAKVINVSCLGNSLYGSTDNVDGTRQQIAPQPGDLGNKHVC